MDNFCIALFFIRNELTALGRVVSFDAWCQWALLSVHMTVTLPYYKFTVQKYIYPSVSKEHTGCFRNPRNSDMDYRIINVRTWWFLCVCIHTGVGHTDSESALHFWLGKIHILFYCSWRGSNLGSCIPLPPQVDISLMILTLMQGHSGSAEAKCRRWIISVTKQATSIKTYYNGRPFLYDLD